MILTVEFLSLPLIRLRNLLSILTLVIYIYHDNVKFVKCFFPASIDKIFFLALAYWCGGLHWFLNTEAGSYSWDKLHLFWHIILIYCKFYLLIFCWGFLCLYLWWILVCSVLFKNIFVLSFSGFRMRMIVAFLNNLGKQGHLLHRPPPRGRLLLPVRLSTPFHWLVLWTSHVADRVLVLRPGVRPEPLRWESRVQDSGPPETSWPHIISVGESSPRDLCLKACATQWPASFSTERPMPNN